MFFILRISAIEKQAWLGELNNPFNSFQLNSIIKSVTIIYKSAIKIKSDVQSSHYFNRRHLERITPLSVYKPFVAFHKAGKDRDIFLSD